MYQLGLPSIPSQQSYINKYNMMDPTFSRPSVDLTSNLVDNVLTRGSQILYEHYLLDRLPSHTTSQNILLIKGIMDPQVCLPSRTRTIINDFQPMRIPKQTLASKSLTIKRIPISSAKFQQKPPMPTQPYKLSTKHRFTASNRSSNPSERPPAATEQSPLIKLTNDLSKQQTEALLIEDKLRKTKHQEWLLKLEDRKRKKKEEADKEQAVEKVKAEFEDLRRRNLGYAYDFDGRVFGCGVVGGIAAGVGRVALSKTICPEMRVKLDTYEVDSKQPLKTRHKSTSNQRTSTSKSQMPTCTAFNTIQSNSKPSKPLRGNSLTSESLPNQTFSNNNKRQLSNANLIELSEGSKLFQLDNHILLNSSKKQHQTLKQFTQTTSRFKSFIEDKPKIQTIDDFDFNNCPEECSKAITTKPSSMSGRTKKYTWRDVDTGRKPATAGETWGRKRSQMIRPKTTGFGRVIANDNMMEMLFQ